MAGILTEQVVSMPIGNPSTNGRSRTFTFMGKVDRVDIDNQSITDWKCTGDPDKTINETAIGFQCELYAAALRPRQLVTELVLRLVKIPGIKFCGKDKGDPGAYEARCIEWIKNEVDGVREHPLILSPARISQARSWLWAKSQRIVVNRRTGDWDTNAKACYTWKRACPCMPLCMCLAGGGNPQDIIDIDYETCDPHPELDGAAGDIQNASNVLTYSSASTHSLCEMKYYWRYQRCLRRRRDVGGDNLRVGSAVHVGLEAFANSGIVAAIEAIVEWQKTNPVLGEDAWNKQLQEAAKARAMVRVAAERWLID